MKVFGVVCEFNPFHNGHKYFLSEAKKAGATHIVCLMSGNFVQRGELAVWDKYERAETAVKYGADLVLELPVPYALGTAETFARGSIGLFDRMGFIDGLYCGCEQSVEELSDFLRYTETEEFQNKLSILLSQGYSYPNAYGKASGDSLTLDGNTVLGLEYMRQLQRLESKIQPVTVKRAGGSRNSLFPFGEYAGATYIRERMRNGGEWEGFTPVRQPEGGISDIKRLDTAILNVLRLMDEKDFSRIADVNGGLEWRIRDTVKIAKSLDEVYEGIATKRYTPAKVRRIILSAFLGVEKGMQEEIPGFVNVLSGNRKGMEIVSIMGRDGIVKPVFRFSDRAALSPEDKRLYDLTVKWDDIYGMSFSEIRECEYDKKKKFTMYEY